MSEDSKTFEKKLDLDFLYYLSLTKNVYANLTDVVHKQFCEIWLAHLFGKNCNTLSEKCDRNIYLSRLLLQMQSGKLNTNFLEPPPIGALPCAFSAFGLPSEVEGLKGFEEMGYQVDAGTGFGSGDFSESSRDGRTYLATRHLPQGVMAFLAVTNNEGEPAWLPQTCPASLANRSPQGTPGVNQQRSNGYLKILRSFTEVPLSALRKSPEERERLLEWMEKIINDCSKWLQGEDPHNMELEQLFEALFEEYKKDPENAELLKHPRTVRNILFRDIRDKISQRRAEMTKRELILDQYEATQFEEDINFEDNLYKNWIKYATKPLSASSYATLKTNYPVEIINRFSELLLHERMLIIEEGERRAARKISLLRQTIIEDTRKELQKLKKATDEYKDYYSIYKDIEQTLIGMEKEYRELCPKTNRAVDREMEEKCRKDREQEIQQAKRNFDKEVKTMFELRAKVDDTKQEFEKMNEEAAKQTEILNCKCCEMQGKMQELRDEICDLQRRRQELRCRLQNKFGT